MEGDNTMKQYVITDAEFEKLLKELELHKLSYGSGKSLRQNVAVEMDRAWKKTKEEGLAEFVSEQAADSMIHDCYRSFLYHVYGWIQEMKK
jgi:hypothetical protein